MRGRVNLSGACMLLAGVALACLSGSLHAAPLHQEIQALRNLGKNGLDQAEELKALDALKPVDRKDIDAVGKVVWDGCLKLGRQLVLYPEKAYCTSRYDGEKFLAAAEPGLFDPQAACDKNDFRRLPAGIVKWLGEKIDAVLKADPNAPQDVDVRLKELQVHGIRIVGAAICDNELNLSDLRFSHPLVLDKAVFRFGIRAKNLSVGGNLSLAGSYVYDNLALSDSKIEGTLFGRGAFMQKVRITDTEILDNIRFNRSVLLNYVNFERMKARGVDLSETKLSTLNIRGGQIAERLNLNDTDAACKYQLENAEINELMAIGAGFGRTRTPEDDNAPTSRRTWSGKPFDARILEVKRVKELAAEAEDCIEPAARFSVTGGKARSVCLQNFRWTVPEVKGSRYAPSVISLKDLTVSDNLRLNIDAPAASAGVAGNDASHQRGRVMSGAPSPLIELIGAKIATLIFDFDDRGRSYRTALDQIGVDRVRVDRIECITDKVAQRRGGPDLEQVAEWLKGNATSLQPFTAFIKAYDNIGADTTDLKAAKAAFEFEQTLRDRHSAILRAWDEKSVLAFIWQDSLHAFVDYLSFGAKWLLGFITDFGFRPAQVIWVVLTIVIVSWIVIRLFMGIVAFSHEKKTGMRAIGWTFLFDRLLPIYRLRDEHYDIGHFYQRGSGPDSKTVRYFGRGIECIPASPRRTRYTELYLDALKALGIILAAFLVAAINALIAR